MEKLAIHGGPKVRTEPFPERAPFGEREEELLLQAVRSQTLFVKSGTFVKELEKEFAVFYGTQHAQASTSGTAAIHTAVGVVNPNPGDEIITAPITDPGSVMPILMQNAVPIFADVDPKTLNMIPESIEANITDRTRAIILVHLFGHPCDIDEVVKIAEKHNVILIEDCCQTHATKYKGRYAGTFGHMGCFSFQQSKHMTTGDGGMILTNDQETYIRLKLFSDKGWDYQYMGERDHAFLAPNYRMTEMQGAVGLAQLEKLRDVVERRIALGKLLTELIGDAPGVEAVPAARLTARFLGGTISSTLPDTTPTNFVRLSPPKVSQWVPITSRIQSICVVISSRKDAPTVIANSRLTVRMLAVNTITVPNWCPARSRA